MPRPKHDHPTPAEFDVLKILWSTGPATVREVMDVLNRRGRRRAYTSVMSLLNVMTDKRLLKRKPRGRAFIYAPSVAREKTLRRILGDCLGRIFDGSASALVAHLLEQADPSSEELEEIRQTIESHLAGQGDA